MNINKPYLNSQDGSNFFKKIQINENLKMPGKILKKDLLNYKDLNIEEKNKIIILFKFKNPRLKPSTFIKKFSNLNNAYINYKSDLKKF